MDKDTYSVIARERWNRWMRHYGIEIFAVRPDPVEFVEHGKAEAAIFLDPKRANHIKPKGRRRHTATLRLFENRHRRI
jgi:hypothetical protein